MTFIKDAMKDVLISSTMSSSDDFFASKSLTIECVLFSNEISYLLKSLIDIKVADYSFINKVIVQIVCDQLQIESLTLIKVKSIWEFNDHYTKKLITHVIYSNLTVQDHEIDTAFMLITQLNQHQMIFKKTWMNKINLVIDMQIDFLRFLNFISSQKLIVLRSDKQNIKVDALTHWVDSVSRSFKNEWCHYQQTTILTLNWMKIADLKKNIDESIYKQILETNKINKNCMLLREAIAKDETQYEDIKLKNCWIQNEILYHDSQLWVSFNELLQMNLICKIHDQLSVDHSDILRTVKVIKRNYYWSFMQKTINQYI